MLSSSVAFRCSAVPGRWTVLSCSVHAEQTQRKHLKELCYIKHSLNLFSGSSSHFFSGGCHVPAGTQSAWCTRGGNMELCPFANLSTHIVGSLWSISMCSCQKCSHYTWADSAYTFLLAENGICVCHGIQIWLKFILFKHSFRPGQKCNLYY